ncbi:hypothetical protein [Archangium primigenium]|uniref:hypothetical protein n=1 Tax=[Archangium] primigenium TaxID=2792470 RepID=UPI00195888CF|nr:hypothetical protein [Archangium primigenium]MBM7112173.1 hypothetical protein [Archangium primigenium]
MTRGRVLEGTQAGAVQVTRLVVAPFSGLPSVPSLVLQANISGLSSSTRRESASRQGPEMC